MDFVPDESAVNTELIEVGGPPLDTNLPCSCASAWTHCNGLVNRYTLACVLCQC